MNMTTAQDQQSRAEFEAWAVDKFELFPQEGGRYSSRYTQSAWENWQAERALPAGVKPVAEICAGGLFWVTQGPDAAPVTGDHDLYTAAQVQAMGRVPACPYPCGWDGLHKIAVADGAYLAHIEWPEDEEGVSVQRAVAMRTVTNLIDVCRAMLAAARKAPAP